MPLTDVRDNIWAAIRKVQQAGYKVNARIGGYSSSDYCLCVLGAVFVAREIAGLSNALGALSVHSSAAQALGISSSAAGSLECGFEGYHYFTDPVYYELGRQIAQQLKAEARA